MQSDRIVIPNATQDQIKDLVTRRAADIFSMPKEWRDPAFDKLSFDYFQTLREPVVIRSSATLGGEAMSLRLEPARDPSKISLEHKSTQVIVDLAHVKEGFHQLRLKNFNYIEHMLSMFAGLGLVANLRLTSPSLPSGSDGLGNVIDAIRDKLIPVKKKELVTIEHPLVIQRSNNRNSYIIILPDDGQNKLILDHQFDHPNDCLKTQRIITTIEPSVFAFLARARTISYGYRSHALRLFGWKMPFTSLSKENVLVAEKRGYFNKKECFDSDGVNREAILHEIVDKLALIGLLQRPFVGKLITRASSHSDDLFAARELQKYLVQR